MPEIVFLTERRPLIRKAAAWLIESAPAGSPVDLSDTVVVVSTSGAARRLRPELARLAGERGAGLLPPRLTTPMGLLVLDREDEAASRTDALLAWTEVIGRAETARYPQLLEAFPDHREAAFQIAESLMEVCSILAEGELKPGSKAVAAASPGHEEERWGEVEELYKRYVARLEKAGLEDGNELRMRAAREARVPGGIKRIVVAGVADLNLLVQRYLERLKGVKVTLLVDAPECEEARFDGFGRPEAEDWTARILPLAMEQVYVAADPVSEAEVVAKLLGSGGAGLCVAVPESLPAHERALRKIGRKAYNPGGRSLATYEVATVVVQWMAFCRGQRLSDLRYLLEHPIFLDALGREAEMSATVMLRALDLMRTEVLVETLPDALAYLRGDTEKIRERLLGSKLLAFAVDKILRRFDVSESLDVLPDFLGMLYEQREVMSGSAEADALAGIGKILRGVLESRVGGRNSERVFREELEAAKIYEARQADEVELNGWLEAAWLPNEALIISGCVEGALPAASTGHAFLPDSVRVKLGLPHQAERLARDIYLLHCLQAVREPGKVALTLSRKGSDEEPAKPSRLLFRCADQELVARARQLFGSTISLKLVHARQQAWKLEIPQLEPPKRLRVTAFGEYLRCPFRFYLKNVLKMEGVDPEKSEMDARDYGIALHKVVENFALNLTLRDSRNVREIETFLLEQLDLVLADLFGDHLLLPVRVQRESLAARLRQFARLQAKEREEGWRVVTAEYRFKEDRTLVLHGIPITASLDRVEVNEFTGQRRILDYKTYAKPKRPDETHFDTRPGDDEYAWSAHHYNGKDCRWKELQLPIYRALAEFEWPEDGLAPYVGYLLLPERLEESGLEEFILGDGDFKSAMTCAEGVLENISRGVFWPPREVEFDDYAEIFAGEDPVNVMGAESVEFLRGRP